MAFARAANIRWIKGDLAGAIQLQTLAVRSGGPGDAGALAWSLCRLGQLVWQQGNGAEATACAARALEASLAVQLARNELAVRSDVMTHAANAMALAGAGWIEEAAIQSRASLVEGTILQSYLGVIQDVGDSAEARHGVRTRIRR